MQFKFIYWMTCEIRVLKTFFEFQMGPNQIDPFAFEPFRNTELSAKVIFSCSPAHDWIQIPILMPFSPTNRLAWWLRIVLVAQRNMNNFDWFMNGPYTGAI